MQALIVGHPQFPNERPASERSYLEGQRQKIDRILVYDSDPNRNILGENIDCLGLDNDRNIRLCRGSDSNSDNHDAEDQTPRP
ncbi:MAG: hypothetical protein Kow0074_12520 [Candidatus Zixiibacteriota bacterium]